MNETISFLSQHGALVLAAAVFAEQIGLPLPALPFLIAAGALVGTGQMGLGMAVVSAILAAMAGDQLWFELGRRRGRLVLNWLCRISLEPTELRPPDGRLLCTSWCPFADRRETRAWLQHDCPAARWHCGTLGAAVPPVQWPGYPAVGWNRDRSGDGVQRPARAGLGHECPNRSDGRSGCVHGDHRVCRLQGGQSVSCRPSRSTHDGPPADRQTCGRRNSGDRGPSFVRSAPGRAGRSRRPPAGPRRARHKTA